MNIIDIAVAVEGFLSDSNQNIYKIFINDILHKLHEDDKEISVQLTDDSTMIHLNREYRGKNSSTDVLSFPQREGDIPETVIPLPDSMENLGDIVISVDTLQRNAEYFTVNVYEELFRVTVHGILHLLGWNHETNDKSETMLLKQEGLLKQLDTAKIIEEMF